MRKLISEVILPTLPPEALADPNVFRSTSWLYTLQMEGVLMRHRPLLEAMFRLYKVPKE